jgi:dolichol-phosphate mannosyltransferase
MTLSQSRIHDGKPLQSVVQANECQLESGIELAIVVPTYNEVENVTAVVAALKTALGGIQWEVIFVDDHSPDGTASYVRQMASRDRRIRILERIGRRGLSSACIEGMLSTPASYIAVMDGDMQHDESVLPKMLECIRSKQLDVVVGSRKVSGGSMGQLPKNRVWLSDLGSKFSHFVCHCDVSDPMSGFFIVNSEYVREVVPRLTGRGFKILVDLLASSKRAVRTAEVPYHFRSRQRGESKLDANAQLEYLLLLVDKVIGNIVPTRFALFVLVGFLGVFVHLGVLGLLYRGLKVAFASSQVAATLVAMISNFLLNNVVTFQDLRLRGWRLIVGMAKFCAACSIGALVNVGLADFLLHASFPWYLAGMAGAAIGSVWNYGVNVVFTWRRGRT